MLPNSRWNERASDCYLTPSEQSAVTSLRQSPVLKGHIFLILS